MANALSTMANACPSKPSFPLPDLVPAHLTAAATKTLHPSSLATAKEAKSNFAKALKVTATLCMSPSSSGTHDGGNNRVTARASEVHPPGGTDAAAVASIAGVLLIAFSVIAKPCAVNSSARI